MTIQISNASPLPLTVWIEPWCDELTLPSRSMMLLAVGEGPRDGFPDIEVIDDRLVVWATAAGTLIVAIDGVEQDTGSRTIALPAALLEMPVKTFVNTVFGGAPLARAAGAPPSARSHRRLVGWWRWAKSLLPPGIRFRRRR
jgi:hypothetical protein